MARKRRAHCMKLSDAAAKKILLKWPERPGSLWPLPNGSASWFRALPKKPESKPTCPRLSPPRSEKLLTTPDGMWVNLASVGLVDVFCIEVCGSLQNFNDKRSRFVAFASSLVVRIDQSWLADSIAVKGGTKTRLDVLGRKSRSSRAWTLPVRHLRVLFALRDEDYALFGKYGVAMGHEYFCKHLT